MPIQNVGDMAQHFQSLRQTGRIKSDLTILSQELSTQQKHDLTQSLGGDVRQLASLDREITMLETYQRSATETGQRLAFTQASLGLADQARGQLMDLTLPVSAEDNDATILAAADAGEATFGDLVSIFNKRFGDRALFSGASVDQPALASADDMLASLRAATAGLSDVNDIKAAVDMWFDDPAGGFATMGYQGDTGAKVTHRISAEATIVDPARADGNASKALLKGAAFAAIATESNTNISMRTRSELVQHAGQTMLNASDAVASLQAEVGRAESTIAETQVNQSTQLTAFQINRNELTVADPFETASRLQDVQQQLEMHYTVTARLSRLSLVNYLP